MTLELKSYYRITLLWILFLLTLCSCNSGKRDKPVIHCASGAVPTLESIQASSNDAFEINTGASGTLARQIEQGMPADLFITADAEWMQYLLTKNLLDTPSVQAVAVTHLVLCKKQESTEKSNSAQEENIRIAIGNPDYVPAGKYALEALEKMGSLEEYKEDLIYTKDVTSAAQLLHQGEVDYAIIYSSVAAITPGIMAVQVLDEYLEKPIRFYVGMVKPRTPAKEELLTLVTSSRQWDRGGFDKVKN